MAHPNSSSYTINENACWLVRSAGCVNVQQKGQEQNCPELPFPAEAPWCTWSRVCAVAAAAPSRFPVGAPRSASAGMTSPAARGFEEIGVQAAAVSCQELGIGSSGRVCAKKTALFTQEQSLTSHLTKGFVFRWSWGALMSKCKQSAVGYGHSVLLPREVTFPVAAQPPSIPLLC